LTDPAGYEPGEPIVYNHNVPIDTADGARKLLETLMTIGIRNTAKLHSAAMETWRANGHDDATDLEPGTIEKIKPRIGYISDSVVT
jgi:hypothetical protein